MRAQERDQFVQFGAHESQTVHARVELYVHRIALDPSGSEEVAERTQRVHVRDAGLKPVLEYFGEEVRPGGQHQYGQRYSVAPEFHSLHRQSHREVVRTLGLEHRCELDGAVSVCIGLHQHQQPRGRLKARPEITEIIPEAGQAQFQTRKVILTVHLYRTSEKLYKIRKKPEARQIYFSFRPLPPSGRRPEIPRHGRIRKQAGHCHGQPAAVSD